MSDKAISIKEAMIFSQRVAQLSKALWKSIEKDWQQWIKPYDLNINEHHILWRSLKNPLQTLKINLMKMRAN